MSAPRAVPRRPDGTVDFEAEGLAADCGGYSYEALGELAARRVCAAMRALCSGGAS